MGTSSDDDDDEREGDDGDADDCGDDATQSPNLLALLWTTWEPRGKAEQLAAGTERRLLCLGREETGEARGGFSRSIRTDALARFDGM